MPEGARDLGIIVLNYFQASPFGSLKNKVFCQDNILRKAKGSGVNNKLHNRLLWLRAPGTCHVYKKLFRSHKVDKAQIGMLFSLCIQENNGWHTFYPELF